jgi:all-trans-retinol 13,14-reductase
MPSHAIVIGSGVSGMSAAIALCKQGWRVLVLEQAARPGGLMASYRRGQCALPTGIHTIGAMGEGQATRRYLEYLGVWSGIHAVPMNVDGYAEFRFPDMSFLMPANYQAFRERLLERFGRQRLAIDQYLQDMKRTALGFPLYSFSTQPYAGGEETRTALQSYLDKLTDDEGLKRVIGAPNLLYGVEPKNCPLFVHFLVVDSYLRSAWRIDEHKAPLAEAFVDALLRAGGRIRCQTRASHFKCSGEQLQSVVVSDGEAIPADIVVYTGHPKRLPALCPPGSLRPGYRNRIAAAEDTLGVFGISLEWRGRDFPFADRDIFLFSDPCTDEVYRRDLAAATVIPAVVYCAGSPPQGPGVHSATILSGAGCGEFSPWLGSVPGRRPADYSQLKQVLAQRLLSAVHEHWPQAREEAVLLDSFTPLTFGHYTASPTGSAYGMKKSLSALRSARVTARTHLRNLFLAGQSVIMPGFLGALISGISVVSAVMEPRNLMEQIQKETA